MADSVKQIKIEGAAFTDYQKSKGLIKQRARKTRKVAHKDEQEGGYDAPPAPRINLKNANITRLSAAADPMKGGNDPQPYPGTPPPKKLATEINGTVTKSNKPPQTPEKSTLPQLTSLTPSKQQGGNVPVTTPGHIANPLRVDTSLPAVKAGQDAGTQEIKSEGGALAQPKGGKIELAPSRKNTKRHGIVLAPPRESKKRHVRGHTRKIRVQLSNMKRRMQTAKLIHRQSSEKSIVEIRKLLEEAKLVKPGKSSVPEPLLRHMYRDYLVLRSKAL